MTISAIVLAAGQGTRMQSEIPKPLHEVCGRSMVMRVIDAVTDPTTAQIAVVIGHDAERVKSHIQDNRPPKVNIHFAIQESQLGTGHAAAVGLSALDSLADNDTVVIVPGDTPLLTRETIDKLVSEHQKSNSAATIVTSVLDDPSGYGRIVRTSEANVARIVEHRDATVEERLIDEVNAGIYAVRADRLQESISQLEANNSQSEFYLTDIVGLLTSHGYSVGALIVDKDETAGVNDKVQLANAERVLRRRIDEGG